MNTELVSRLLIVTILLGIAFGASVELNDFSITGFSAQWTAYNGDAANLLPVNNPFQASSPFWNSGLDWGIYPQPYWVSFDLGAERVVTAFEFISTGDITHDAQNFELIAFDDFGNVIDTLYFVAASGTTSLQVFTFSTPVVARYWKFNILDTYSQYQVYVAYVNFFVAPKPLNIFSAVSVSAEWAAYNGYVTNLLPINNPNQALIPFWNSGADWDNYPQPYWVVFDLETSLTVYGVQLLATGDVTHDPQNFEIQYSSSDSGPFTTAEAFVAASGSSQLQTFELAVPVNARYFKLNILDTYSQYQVYVSYFNFLTL